MDYFWDVGHCGFALTNLHPKFPKKVPNRGIQPKQKKSKKNPKIGHWTKCPLPPHTGAYASVLLLYFSLLILNKLVIVIY